jgi:hypothetical protein
LVTIKNFKKQTGEVFFYLKSNLLYENSFLVGGLASGELAAAL